MTDTDFSYDLYAAAREEYRKKIAEQAAEIKRLCAALTEIRDAGPMTVDDQRWRVAKDALEGKQ